MKNPGKLRKRRVFGGEEAVIGGYEQSRVAVLPVPYEATTTYGKGTRNGPEAILRASENMELYDEEIGAEIFKIGIHTLPPLSFKSKDLLPGAIKHGGRVGREGCKSAFELIEDRVRSLLNDGKFPAILGGEHSITPSVVSAFMSGLKHCDLTVVQLDAHADLRDSYLGSKFNHACAMARVTEMCHAVQIGIRSMSFEESQKIKISSRRAESKNPFMYQTEPGRNWIVFASDMQDEGWIDKILPKIYGKVYLTIDLDYFDPSIMPSVGTPEPGGGHWHHTLEFLKKLSKKTHIVGLDVVELCPQRGNPASDFLAARLISKVLGYIFHRDLR
ncbi:MAG: agmatinase [Acidobacteriota bacterium]